MSFVNLHNDYHEGFEDGRESTSNDLKFLINKLLNCDLFIEDWNKEDQEKFNEIKEIYLNDN